MIFILNRQEKVVATIKNSGGVFDTPPFFDDILIQDLPTGAETFTFTTPARGNIARSLVVGNFVAFKKDKEYKLFQIMRTEESHEDAIYTTVYGECAGLELINKVFRKTTINSCTLKQFMTSVLQDTGWEIGCLPLHEITLDLELEDASVYEIIQNTLGRFSVELEFAVEINQGRISKKIINVHRFRGKVTGKRFEFGQDINAIQRTIDSTELYTALIGKGKENINFSEITVEGIEKPLGQDFVADQESFNRYNHNGYHIMGVFAFDTTSPEELLRETYKALQKTKIPKVTYEVDVALLGELLGQDWNNVSIGDTVAIVDNAFNPPINLMARVAKLETSFTDPQSNKCTLTNFIEVKSNITDEMRKLAGMLEGYVDNSIGGKFPIGTDDILDGAINGDKIYKETIQTDHLIAECVTAEKIKANSITADHIVAGSITADKIDVTFIQGVTGQFENLFADIARIDHIFAGNITADMLAAGTITGGSGVIGDASIGTAQISELSANKIRTGTLDTSLVTVSSKDGEIEITGYQVLVHDTTDALNKINRVVLGKYKKGETYKYGLVVRGEDGQTIMLDEQGVHNAGITSGAVDDNKIADDANIKGWKLDINSVIRSINEDGTELIAGTVVRVGDRTLEVELSTQKNLITDNKKQLETQKSQIIALDNKIQLKVDKQVFTETISQVNQKTLEEVAKAKIELKKEITETNTALDNLNTQINGAFKDGVISEVEAITIKNNIQQLEREKLDLHEQYLSIYNNSDISKTARNNLYQAKQDYETKHIELITAIEKAIEDMKATPQEATEVNNRTKAYSLSLATLSKRMNEAIDSIVTTRTQSALAQALKEIEKAKSDIRVEINDVTNSLGDLNTTINTTFKDGVISESECKSIAERIKQLDKEMEDVNGKYESIYNHRLLSGVAKTNLYNSKQDVDAKSVALKTSINTAIEDKKATVDEKTDVDSKMVAYGKSLSQFSQKLNDAIDFISSQKSDNALAEAISKINEAKNSLQTEINDVSGRIDDLVLNVDGAIKDGIISETEALILANDIKQLDKEKADLDKQYLALYNNPSLTGDAKLNLGSAKTSYDTVHNNLKKAIQDAIANKTVSEQEKVNINNLTKSYTTTFALFSQRITEALDSIVDAKTNNALAQAIEKVNQAKLELKKEIIDVNTSLGDLSSEIHSSFKDGIISEAEALAIKENLRRLGIEKIDLDRQYSTIYANNDLTGNAKNNLYYAKSDFDAKHNELVKAIETAIADGNATPQEKTLVDTKTKEYSNVLSILSQRMNEAIDNIATNKSNSALAQAIEKVNQAKLELKKEIIDVNTSLGDLSSEIHSSFKDGIISESESITIGNNIKQLDKEKADLDNQYTTIYNNSSLTGNPKNNLYHAKTDFDTKHTELKTSITQAIEDKKATPAEKIDVDNKTKAYAISLATLSQRLTEAIDNIATNKADGALSEAIIKINEAKKQLKTEINDVVTSVGDLSSEIHSSFKDGIISESESITIGNNIKQLDKEKADLDNQYTTIYNNSSLTGNPKNNLYHAKTDFDTKHTELKTSITQAIEDKKATPAEKIDVDNKTKAYAISLATLSQRLTEAIDNIATNKSNSALSEAIIKINEAKKLLMNEVLDINNRIDDLIFNVDGAIKDGIIDEMEAIMLENDIKQLDKEKGDLDKQYSVIYINSDLTGNSKTNLYNAKIDFDDKHSKLVKAIQDAIANKMVNEQEKININNLTKAYSISLALYSQRLSEAIDNIATNKANSALSQAIAKINEAKNQLRVEISQVSGSLNSLETTINTSFKDGVISEAETLAIKENIKRLQVEKADVDKKYEAIYANRDLSGSPKTNLYNAKSDFDTNHTNLIKAIETAIADKKATTAEKTDIDNKTNLYSSSLGMLSKRLEEAIDSIATKKTDDALAQALAEIEKAKKQLKAEITDVGNSLTSLDNEIKTSFKDGIISEAETIAIKESLKSLDVEKKDVDRQYTSIYSNTSLEGVAQTNLYYAKKDYDTKHTDLKNAINSAIADKIITPTENTNVANKTNAYGEALALLSQRLNEAIDAIATKKTDNSLAEAIAKINEAKSQLRTEINDVKNSLSSLEGTLNGAFHDGIISEAEAIAIGNDLKQLNKEKEDIDAKVQVVYANNDLTGIARTNLEHAKSDFNGKHTTLKQTIESVIADGKATASEKMQVNDATFTYSKSLATLSRRINEAIDSIASKKTQDAIISSNEYTDGQVTIVTKKLEKATSELKILQDQISMKVEELEVKTTNVETTVKNLNVGGRNLIRNSGEFKNLDFWNGSNAVLESKTIRASGTLKNSSTIKLEPNKDYIYSIEIKPTRNLNVTENSLLGYELVTVNSKEAKNWSINTINEFINPVGWAYMTFTTNGSPNLTKCETQRDSQTSWRDESIVRVDANTFRCYIYIYENPSMYRIRLTDSSGNTKVSNDFRVATTGTSWNINTIPEVTSPAGWTYANFSVTGSPTLTKCETQRTDRSSWNTENLVSVGNNSYKCYIYAEETATYHRIRLTDNKGVSKISNDFKVSPKETIPPPTVDNPPSIGNIYNITSTINQSFNISYTASDDNGINKHEFSENGGSSYVTINPSKSGNNYSYTKSYSSTGTRNCKIRVTDTKGETTTSNTFSISISSTPVTDNRPNINNISNITNYINENFYVDYVASDDNGVVKHEFSDNNGSSFTNISPSKDGNNYRFVKSYSTEGTRTCIIRVSDSKNQTATSNSFSITINRRDVTPPPTTNSKPVISGINVSNANYNGSYTLSYTASDSDGDSLTHRLKIDNNSYVSISPSKSGNNYSYNGNGLASGRHTCYVQVSDGKDTTTSSGFVVEIPTQVVSDSVFQSMEIVSEKSLVANKYTRVVLKLRTKETINENYRLNPKITEANTFYIKNAQFEMGNKVSAWTPSDLDTDQAIKNNLTEAKDYADAQVSIVDTKISQAKSEIVVLKDKITQTVTKNEFNSVKIELDGKIAANKTEISNNKAEIVQTTDGIKQQVSNLNATTTTLRNDLTGVTNRVDTVSSKVTTLETSVGKITAQVKDVEIKVESTGNKVNNLQGSINSVSQSVGDLNTTMNGAFKDGVLSSAESIAIKEQIAIIDREKAELTKKYTDLYNNTDLSSSLKTEMYNAKQNYDSVHTSLKNTINSAISDKKITTSERTSIDNSLSSYSTSLSTLSEKMNKAINDIASNKSNNAFNQAVSKVNEAKTQLQGSINSVSSSVTNLNNTMNGAFKDGVLSSAESIAIKEQIAIIDREKVDLDKKYNVLYGNVDLTGNAKTELSNAKSSYNTSNTNLKNSINSAISDSNITTTERNDINSKLSSYSSSLATLSEKMENAINAIATKKSLDALTNANAHTDGQIITVNNKISGIKIEQDKINSTVGNVTHTLTQTNDKLNNTDKKVDDLKVNTETRFTQLIQDNGKFQAIVSHAGGNNIIKNSTAMNNDNKFWHYDNGIELLKITNSDTQKYFQVGGCFCLRSGYSTERAAYTYTFRLKPSTNYTITFKYSIESTCKGIDVWLYGSAQKREDTKDIDYNVSRRLFSATSNNTGEFLTVSKTFKTDSNEYSAYVKINNNGIKSSGIKSSVFFGEIMLVEGELQKAWSPNPTENYVGITTIDTEGVRVEHNNANTYTQMSHDGMYIVNKPDNRVIANFGTSDGGSFSNLQIDNIFCDRLQKYVPHGSPNLYVSQGGRGSKSGINYDNAAASVKSALDNWREAGIVLRSWQNITINVDQGEYFDDTHLQGFTGVGSITIKYNPNAKLTGSISVSNCSCNISIEGNNGNSAYGTGLQLKTKGQGNAIEILSSGFVRIANIRFKSQYNKTENFILARNSQVMIARCDISNTNCPVVAQNTSLVCIYACIGSNNSVVGAAMWGSTCVSAGDYCPQSDNKGYIRQDGGGIIRDDAKSQSASQNSTSTGTGNKTMTSTFSAYNYRSYRKSEGWKNGFMYQGSWHSSYGDWKGQASVDCKSWAESCTNKGGMTGRMWLQRKSNGHGASGGANVRICDNNGNLYGVLGTLNLGESRWFTLPTNSVQALIRGDGICFYSANANEYIQYNNNAIIELTGQFNV